MATNTTSLKTLLNVYWHDCRFSTYKLCFLLEPLIIIINNIFTVDLMFEILLWEVEEAHGIKFVAVNRQRHYTIYTM